MEAVTVRGSPSVSSGSTTASRGNMEALRRLAFTRCSGEPSTALRVTSEPVPAVVGTAMNGAGAFTERLPAADHFEISQRPAGIGEHGRQSLARIDGAAAADGNHQVATLLLRELQSPGESAPGWFAGHREWNRVEACHQRRHA